VWADAGAQAAPKRPLTIQLPSLPTQLNPLLGRADIWCWRISMHNIFEPLLRRVGETRVRPHLARSFEWSENRRRLRLRLRRDVFFHDGRPLTADDVVYTLERLLRRNTVNRLLKQRLGALRQVREISEGTVELVLSRVDSALPKVLADVGIVPAHRYRRFGLASERLNAAPIGSGPFRFAPSASPSTLVLTRNDSYWGPPPGLPRVVFRAIPDPARTLPALRNGTVDVLPDLYTGYYPKHVSGERFKDRFAISRLHPYRLRVLLFNLDRRPLDDRRVRLALLRAIDRARLLRGLRGDLGQLLSAPLWPLSSWYDRTLHPRSHDRKAAAKLLRQAGWRAGKGGKRWRLDKALKLRILRAKGDVPRQVADAVVKDLRALGIDAGVDVADFAFFRTLLRKGSFDLAVLGLALGPHEDLGLYLHSKGRKNFGRYRNKAVDALLDGLRKGPSEGDHTRDGRQLHRLLYADPPLVVLYEPIELMVANRRVRGLVTKGNWPQLSDLRLNEGEGER
jgi:peptide/nickel transport system substrate-binding protein